MEIIKNPPKDFWMSIRSSCLGNVLEWYDFGLFSIFASVFSQSFFPSISPYASQLATFAIFAIGFFCRPLGAVIFGFIGDKVGRAFTLRYSILMISIPTLAIGLIPTYQQIGIAAPLLLIMVRMLQGISIGGEYSGNLIYLAESAPNQQRALVTSFASSGSNFGILLASLVGFIVSSCVDEKVLFAWGWRIPYIISGLISLVIYFTRLNMPETKVYSQLKNKNLIAKNPIKRLFRENKAELFKSMALVGMGSTFYYFCFIYLPTYLTGAYQVSVNSISLMISAYIMLMIFLVPLAGYVCDKIGRRKMLLANAIFITCIVVPGFFILNISHLVLYTIILFLFTLASSSEQGATPISVVEIFPAATRYSGVSLSYNLGNGIFGGTVPIICTWLQNSSLFLSPAFYIAVYSVIALVVTYFLIPETNHKSLFTAK